MEENLFYNSLKNSSICEQCLRAANEAFVRLLPTFIIYLFILVFVNKVFIVSKQ
jgi:hypothetical protein